MTAVKIRKRRPSKQRRMRRMTVAGGEKSLHSDKEEKMFCYLCKIESSTSLVLNKDYFNY